MVEACATSHLWRSEQLGGLGYHLPTCGSWGSNSGHQTWWQVYWLQLTYLTGSDICYFCQPSIPVSPSMNNTLFVFGKSMSVFPYHVTWRDFLLSLVLQVAWAWLGSKAASTATMLSVGGRYTAHVGKTSSFSLEFARRKVSIVFGLLNSEL